jgi:hypothetical protein
MILLVCGSKRMQWKKLKLSATQQQKNKRVELTLLPDPLGTTCGPPVEKLWSIQFNNIFK